MRTLSQGVGILILLLLQAACQQPSVTRSDEGVLFLGTNESSDTVERVVAPGNRTVVLEGFAGDIRLSASDSDVVRLAITRRARGDSPTEATANLAGLDIQEEGDERTFRYRFIASQQSLSSFDVEGVVPRQTPLTIKWTSGTVEVDGIAANVELQTANGDVGYSGSASKARLTSRNGSVSATIVAVTGPVDYDLSTANGDVALSLPANLDAHIDASTSAGSIRTGAFPFVSERFGPVAAGARFQARLGAGNGRVRAATQHGSVLISSFVPPPPPAAPDSTAAPPAADSLAAPSTMDALPEVPAPPSDTVRKAPMKLNPATADTVIASSG